MNKMIKLPLFLGVVGCLCGGILAVTNYFTKDIIAENEAKIVNAAYMEHFDNLVYKKSAEISDDLSKTGVTEKLYFYDSNKEYIGTIYSVSAVGYAGKSDPIKFTVSFSSGTVHHYVEISNAESSVGSQFMNWLAGDNNGDRVGDLDTGKAQTGSSVSYSAVKKAVDACSADYLAEYTAVPAYVEGDK